MRESLEFLLEKRNNAQIKLRKLLSEQQNIKHAIAKKKYYIQTIEEKIEKEEKNPLVDPMSILRYLEEKGQINLKEVIEEIDSKKKHLD